MQTVLSLPIEREGTLPEPFLDDLRFPDTLVRTLLERFTDEDDLVLDPFSGFGTVPRVAQSLGRRAYGLELDEEKVEYARETLESDQEDSDATATIRHGDALELSALELPQVDFCLTSPPFATDGTTVDPLRNYTGEGGYETYLEDLQTVFTQVNERLRPGGRIVLEISNLKHEETVTTLAWDVADALSSSLRFEGEIVVTWEGGPDDGYSGDGTYGYGYDHSYCLVFEATE